MLDVDRLADVIFEGTKALIAKELAPIVAANEALTARNLALETRLVEVERREVPALPAHLPTADDIKGWSALVERAMHRMDEGVQEAVSAAVAAIGPVQAPDVAPMVNEAVRAAVGALLPQESGRDAGLAEIEALRAEIGAVRREIPVLPESPDLTVFATKAEVGAIVQRIDELPPPPDYDQALSDVRSEIADVRCSIPMLPDPPDLSGFATKEQVDLVARRIEELPAPTDYGPVIDGVRGEVDAIRREIPVLPEPPDLSGFATKAEFGELQAEVRQLPAPPPDRGPEIVALREELTEVRKAIPEPVELPDLSPFATKADLAAIGERVDAIPAPVDHGGEIASIRAEIGEVRSIIPDVPDPPDLSGFATLSELDAAIAGVPVPDLSGVATKAELGEVEACLRASIPEIPDAPDLSPFATKAEVADAVAAVPQPDLAGFVTKADLGAVAAEIRREIPAMPEVIHGRDGVGISEVKQNADGELIVKLANGETFNAGRVRGADGFGFEHMASEDGEREFAIVFSRGEEVKRFVFAKGVIIDRGVWREGEFKRGDAVTWGGSLFIAQRDTTDKPETSDAWRLSVKRGRDGRDFRPPEEPRGPIKVGAPKK